MPDRNTVVCTLRYKDPDSAITWLENALGFTRHAIYRHPEHGFVVHAELLLRRKEGGVGMIMLGSTANESEMASHYRQPSDVGGVTASAYLIVDDCDPVYAAVEQLDGEILMSLRTMDYGGKAFTVRDPEGHIWAVGEYDPFAAIAAEPKA